jgi:Type I restriction enzyme R protein N terminus (HSDR_N)
VTISLAELLKDSACKLSQFKPAQISALEAAITLKDAAKKPIPYVTCLVRGKPIKLTPEETVRQLYVMVLRDDLGYPVSRMEQEYGVTMGREIGATSCGLSSFWRSVNASVTRNPPPASSCKTDSGRHTRYRPGLWGASISIDSNLIAEKRLFPGGKGDSTLRPSVKLRCGGRA